MLIPTTLTLAAAAILINLWHFIRIVRVRLKAKVIHGDGGLELLARRMRAHANFIENAPLTLILIAAIELSGKGGSWLAIAGALFMLTRIAHGFGMDRDGENVIRSAGVRGTLRIQVGHRAAAVLIAVGRF